jgi:protoheme IX farnesyltransferase
MTSSAETAVAQHPPTPVLALMVELSKPRITRMVLMTALAGAWVAPGAVEPVRLVLALLSTALVVAGANALNMYLERDADALMTRTRDRPLPSGRTTPEFVLAFGGSASVLGVALMVVLVNPLAAALAALALVSYTLVYTPLKQRTPYALHAGAVPGAIPPLIGYAAMTGRVDPVAAELALLLLLWQLPHFMAIALFRLSEYRAAGMLVYPLVKGEARTKVAMVFYSVLLALASMLPVMRSGAGLSYGLGLAVLGLVFIGWCVYGFFARDTRVWARGLFILSLPYLLVLYAAVVVGAA